MMKILIKTAVIALALAATFVVAGVCQDPVKAATDIQINETNFPDDVFRNWILGQTYGQDEILTQDEINTVTNITVSDKSITDLTGIEYFTSLEYLYCYKNQITKLDVTKNTKLKKLYCYYNLLTELNVSKCYDLFDLQAGYNQLTKLNVADNTNLEKLYCNDNLLSSLDVSNNGALIELRCYNNNISVLDLSKNTNLEKIYCYKNQLTKLDVSKSTNLDTLWCYNNLLTKLDVSKNTKLEKLYCNNNLLNELNVRNAALLSELRCYSNQLTALDLSDNTALSVLWCYANKITELDLSNNILLNRLQCNKNQLTELDVSHNPELEVLNCERNQIVSLDISNNHKLMQLHCYENKLTSLDVSNHSALKYLSCYQNEIVSLDMRNTPELSDPGYFQNPIQFLNGKVYIIINYINFPDLRFRDFLSAQSYGSDGVLKEYEISNIKEMNIRYFGLEDLKGIEFFTALENLECATDELNRLDLSKNTMLKVLILKNLRLTELDISNNTKLEELTCYDNNLSYLNITHNPNLVCAYTNGNKNELYDYGFAYLNYDYSYEDKHYVLNVDKSIPIFTKDPTPAPVVTAGPSATPKTSDNVSLTLNKKTANIVCGGDLTLKATLKGSTSKFVWSTSDKKIATVDSNGKVTAKMAGKITITAAAAGKSAKCTVTVLYKDVTNPDDFWYLPTNCLTAAGVVKGYANQTEFRPANKCTRAQMVTFLYRLQGEPKTKSDKCQFDDVKSTDYFYKPVIWAYENGITTGVSKTKFDPQRACSRAQTVTFLWRMAGKPAPGKTAKTFPDVKSTDYFYKATLWASDMKILAGLPDGRFNPDGMCLRRQMVTFLYKYDKFVNKKG